MDSNERTLDRVHLKNLVYAKNLEIVNIHLK